MKLSDLSGRPVTEHRLSRSGHHGASATRDSAPQRHDLRGLDKISDRSCWPSEGLENIKTPF